MSNRKNMYRRVLCLLLMSGYVNRRKLRLALRIAREFPDNSI